MLSGVRNHDACAEFYHRRIGQIKEKEVYSSHSHGRRARRLPVALFHQTQLAPFHESKIQPKVLFSSSSFHNGTFRHENQVFWILCQMIKWIWYDQKQNHIFVSIKSSYFFSGHMLCSKNITSPFINDCGRSHLIFVKPRNEFKKKNFNRHILVSCLYLSTFWVDHKNIHRMSLMFANVAFLLFFVAKSGKRINLWVTKMHHPKCFGVFQVFLCRQDWASFARR